MGSEEAGLTSVNKNNSANYRCKKKYVEAFRGIYVFEDARKNLKFNLVLVVVHAVESKGLCWQPTDECILLEAISI